MKSKSKKICEVRPYTRPTVCVRILQDNSNTLKNKLKRKTHIEHARKKWSQIS